MAWRLLPKTSPRLSCSAAWLQGQTGMAGSVSDSAQNALETLHTKAPVSAHASVLKASDSTRQCILPKPKLLPPMSSGTSHSVFQSYCLRVVMGGGREGSADSVLPTGGFVTKPI